MILTKFNHQLPTQQIVIKVDPNVNDQENLAEIAGSLTPLIRFHDEAIDFHSIESLDLSIGNDLIPTVSISLNDVDERFKYKYPSKIGSIFTCFIGHAKDELHKPIKGDFYVSNVSTGYSSYRLTGTLNLPEMYVDQNRVFEDSTSLEVFEILAKECKLGFVTNIDTTQDPMNWIQYQNNKLFIEYLSKKCFVSNDSLIKVFIDQYWNLNVIDIRKALLTDPTEMFQANPVTGEPLNEKDTIIAAINMTKNSDKYERFIYDTFSMSDDYGTIAMTKAKTLSLVDLNVSTFDETSLSLHSPHDVHISDVAVFTSFSNDNAFEGYFQSNIRNDYNMLMLNGQKFNVTTGYYIPGIHLYMSFHQEIWNPYIKVAKPTQDPSTTIYEDDKEDEEFKSMEFTLNEKLSGDVFVTGYSISYSQSSSEQNSALLNLNLTLLLKNKVSIEADDSSSKKLPTTNPNSTSTSTSTSTENQGQQEQPIYQPATKNKSGQNFNIPRAVATLNKNALSAPSRYCARYVRYALEGGGLNTTGHPGNARQYDPFLAKLGFTEISRNNYTPKAGDICIWQSYRGGHPAGHACMFSGSVWISDFKQIDMAGGSGRRAAKPPYRLWRWI